MPLFKKKEDKVPELPPYSENLEKREFSQLPSLPEDPDGHFSNNLVKMSLDEKDIREGDTSKFKPSISEGKIDISLPEKKDSGDELLDNKNERKRLSLLHEYERNYEEGTSVFVKIEKFRSAKKEMLEVKKTLDETNYLLKKLNEVKVEEDEEIKDISLNLESLKKRLSKIESLVFDKI